MAMRGVIFMADDEPDFRDGVTELLEDHGYVVLPARDGREALARMHGFTGRGVAVIDLGMPAMDGLTLIRAMRADASLDAIRIIVVTGDDIRVIEGADAVLRKPCDARLLVDTIARLHPPLA